MATRWSLDSEMERLAACWMTAGDLLNAWIEEKWPLRMKAKSTITT